MQEVSGGAITVKELWRYPVKSFLGESLDEASLDARGLAGDRIFAVVDSNGKLGSGKTTPHRMRLLRGLFDFAARANGERVIVTVPGHGVFHAGDAELDALLSERYGEPLALRREQAVSHFDAGPVHVLTTSSLRWVATGFGETAGESRRYRPNIVLSTPDSGLVEDGWAGARLTIGACVLRITDRVERCVMPTYAQGEVPAAPALLKFLGDQNETTLGVYAEVLTPGTVVVGDGAVIGAG